MTKVWSIDEGFIDFDYSTPQYGSEAQAKIYIKEYWKNKQDKLLYKLVKENNRWVIDTITEETIFNFK
ncbi:hypothetical protein D3C73_1528800 [compost metagenome]